MLLARFPKLPLSTLTMKKLSVLFDGVAFCFCFCAFGFSASASMFWDPTGTALTTTGNGSWEGLVWATNGVPTNAPIAFVEGSFVVFSVTGEGATAITCTANADHTFAGIFNGGTGGATTCANLVINGTGILSFSGIQGLSTSSGGFTTISNVLAGTGTLQNGSSGQLFLNGVNTFSGGVNVAATGLINFNNPSSFGTGPINWNSGGSGGAFVVEGSSAITIPNNFVVNANYSYNLVGNTAGVTYSGNWNLNANTISLGSGGSVNNMNILSGLISGSGGVGRQSQATAGIIKYTGANIYTGKSSIQSGITSVSSINSVANPPQQISSNMGKPSSAANGAISFGSAGNGGTLLYTGPGETTDRIIDLAGTTGGGTIQNDGTGPLVFTSDLNATNTGIKTLTLTGANTGNNTFSGKIANGSSTVAVTKGGAGTWILSGANTHSGGTTLSSGGGRLNLASASALGTGTFTIGGNSTFDNTTGSDLTVANAFALTGGSPTYAGSANNMTINGAVNVNNNRTITVSANTLTLGSTITQDATPRNFTKAGAGTLLLASGAAYSGNTTVSGGSLVIGGSGQMGAGNYTGTIADNATFNYSSSAAQTLAGVISGTGAVIQNGPGTLTLSAANAYSGATTVSAGTLDISASGSLSASPITVANGATLQLDSSTGLGSAVNLLLNSGSPVVNLNYVGTDQIQLLSFDGGATFVAAGIYGSIGSGATFQDARFTGPGLLAVLSQSTTAVSPSANPATYGDIVTLTATVSGSGPTPTGTVSFKEGATIIGTQTLDGTGNATLSTNGFSAATHSITVVYGGDITYAPSTSPVLALVVNKAALSVTANNQNKVYGQTVTFGAGGTAFGSSGLQNGDTIGSVTLTCAGGDPTAPISGSPYTITPSAATGGTFKANNYTITYNTASLTVNPAILTVTATGLLVYGSDPTNAVYSPQYATLQGTDTVAVIAGSANFSTDATSSNYVGSNYVAHVVDTGTLSSPNYTFAPGPDGFLTITNRPLTVTNIIAQDKVYDGTATATLDVSGAGLNGLVNGDETSVTLVSTSATGTFADRNVGLGKTVSVSGLTTAGDLGTNYFLIQPTTTANISKLFVTVTAVTDTKIYDGTTSSAGAPVATPPIAPGDTASFSQAFDTKNAGTGKTLSPSGFVDDSNDGVNYNLTFASVTTGTISPKSITVTAVSDTKAYDGTPASSAVPGISPALITGDTPNFSEIFDNKNAGTGKTLFPQGSVNDGNSGGNYAVSFVNDTTGVITALPITVTAVSDTKVYDGTTNSTATPTVTPALVSGDTSEFSEAYDTKNVGTGKTLIPGGQARDGNGGLNYSVTFVNDTTGVITQMPITVTAVATTKAYDGTTSSAGDPTISPFLGVGDIANFSQTYDTKNIGTDKTLTPAGSVNDGNSGANYSVTFFNNTHGIIIPLTTTNILVSSGNPSELTTNVTFTVTVVGVPPATEIPPGQVVFSANGLHFATNTLVAGTTSAQISSLPLGTNTITTIYFGNGNFASSVGSLDQVVVQTNFTYSTTNIFLGIANNNDGTFTLSLLGTPGSQYYIISSPDAALPLNGWTVVGDSTNTASSPDGFWSYHVVVSNDLPAFFRSVAIHPAP
jgi:autotransporter-associated beta strand protein